MTNTSKLGMAVLILITIVFTFYIISINRKEDKDSLNVTTENHSPQVVNIPSDTIQEQEKTPPYNEDTNDADANHQEEVQKVKIEEENISEGKELVNDKTSSTVSNDGFSYGPIPDAIQEKMKGVSWKADSPVSLEELNYIKVLHWGFDGKEHQGELIVHKKLAEEVMSIFQDLYEEKFPIEKIKLIDEYEANDDRSMEDNNTSAFCFRPITGQTGSLSKHSYGIAIDINPIQNPYIKGKIILPPEGKEFVDRKKSDPGMIIKDGPVYKAFIDRGWTWGGDWSSPIDYQHFEKRIEID